MWSHNDFSHYSMNCCRAIGINLSIHMVTLWCATCLHFSKCPKPISIPPSQSWMQLKGVSGCGGDGTIPFGLFKCNYLLYPSFVWQPNHQGLALIGFEVPKPREKLVVFLCPFQGLQRYARLHPSSSPSMDRMCKLLHLFLGTIP
jgi:hypothetical protein